MLKGATGPGARKVLLLTGGLANLVPNGPLESVDSMCY
jgi:hypothetical protein